jgi:tetratricopeptide (TPR) repeat protein
VPVLLILFKGTDFKKIAVIYFFTILPAFFLEPIATVRSKFQLFTTTALPVIAFALAINYRSVLIFMKDRWQHVFTGIAKYKQPQNQSDADSFIMSEFFRVENILPTLLLMVAGVVLIWYQLYYGAVIVQLILIWLYYTANKYIKWYALVFFVFISLLFKSVLYVLGSEYSVLLQYFIIVILLDVGMVYAAPMLFFLLAHIMLYGGFKDIFRAIFSVILFLGKSRLANKYRLFMLVVMIVLAGINLIKHNPEWRVSTFGIGVLLFGLIVIFNELAFKNKAPVRLVGTLIIPFYVLVCLISAGVQLKPVVKSEWFTHAQAVSQKSETIADSTLKKVGFVSNRPLGYVEAPVKGKDPVGIQIGTSLVVLGKYLKLVIVPFPLLFYYGYRLIEPTQFLSFPAIGSLIAYIALVITGIYFIRREKLITAGIMWYIISVAPFSNLTNLLPGVMGERYLLVPSFGITILVIALIFRFFKLDKQSEAVSTINKLKYVLLPVLMILSGEVISRNMQWKDDLTLMRHDVQYADNGANVHNILALHLMQYSTTEPNPVNRTAIEKEALFHFKRALSIYPQYFNVAYDIGRVYTALNMPDSAIVAYKYALAIDTTYPNLHQNLAELLINAGRDSEAIPSLIFMVHDEPTIYNHYSRLSYSYYKLKQFEKAIEVNRLAMIHTPAAAEAATNIGRTYVAMNLPDSALFYYNTARKLVPGDSAAQHFINNLETELKNKK